MENLSANWCENPSSRARLLKTSFFRRPTLIVAYDLLGKVVEVRGPNKNQHRTGRIVEVEAYFGDDPASHSRSGITPRCAPMFEAGGITYVYLIYGRYPMLNFVTEKKGFPGAVLIRALDRPEASGPGRLAQALGIKLSHTGLPLNSPRSPIRVWDDGSRPASVVTSPRVGLTKGREPLWRFGVENHPCLSRAPENRLWRRLG